MPGFRLRRIEEAALNSWPAKEQLLYDGWLLRFGQGYTKRANSVNCLGPGELGLDQKIPYCEERYTQQGLPVIFRLAEPWAPPELDLQLQKRGYRELDHTSVQAAGLGNEGLDPDTDVEDWSGRLSDWCEVHADCNGKDGVDRRHLGLLERIPGRKAFLVLRENGECSACAAAVLDGEYVGLFDFATRQSQRRRGLGSRLLKSVLQWGASHGATTAYLQVVQSNMPAIQLYAKFGFREVYRYWYRAKD